jgi:hypothetical protein
MGIWRQKPKSQAKACAKASFEFVQSFGIEYPDFVDSLALLMPGKQQTEAVKGDGQDDVALHPHFTITCRTTV